MSSSSSSLSSLQEAMHFTAMNAAPKQVSLTLNILNQNDLRSVTKTRFGGALPGILELQEDALFRGDVSRPDGVWGFEETFCSKNKDGLSTAVVFTGQKIAIEIATTGHGVGYCPLNGGIPVFSNSKLVLTLYDTLRGTESSVEFTQFDSDSDDPSRYIEWVVPEREPTFAEALYSSLKYHGQFLLWIKEDSTYYSDPAKTKPIGISYPKNSYVRFYSYWWNRAIPEIAHVPSYHNVQGLEGINIFESVMPIDGEPPVRVFDGRTTIAPLASRLTDNQKEVIIYDQAAWFLSSELPLLTLDAPRGTLFGAGHQTSPTDITTPVVFSRERAFAKAEVSELSRRFSMLSSPVANNCLDNLLDYQPTSTSNLRVYDPPTTVCIDKTGTIQSKIGVDGIDFTGSISKVSSIAIPSNVTSSLISVDVGESSPKVDNLVATVSGDYITVTFTVDEEEDRIDSVSYQIGLDDQSDLIFWTDVTGTLRSCSFDVGPYTAGINSETAINVQLAVSTNDGYTYFFSAIKSMAADENEKPSIPFLSVKETKNGSGFIQIDYVYLHDNQQKACTAELLANYVTSGSYGPLWEDISEYAYGDVGEGIMPGHRRILVSLFGLPETSALRSGVAERVPLLAFKVLLTDLDGNEINATSGLAISIKMLDPQSRSYNQSKEDYTLDPAITIEPEGASRYGIYYGMEEDQSLSSVESFLRSSSSSLNSSSSSMSSLSSSSLSSSSLSSVNSSSSSVSSVNSSSSSVNSSSSTSSSFL